MYSTLVYENINNVDFSTIQNVLFVDSAVQQLQEYTNSTTFSIGYNTSSSTDEVLQLLRSVLFYPSFNRIGFAFHYAMPTPFMNNENLFPYPQSDLEKVEFTDKNVIFMLNLIREFNIGHVDFLACNTLQSESWRQYYQFLFAQTGVIVGASDNETGNIKYGGDWVMESDMEDISTIYFTKALINYSQLLTISYAALLNSYIHTFYTVLPTTPKVMTRMIYDNVGNMLDRTDISYGDINILNFLSIMDSSGGGTNPYSIGVVDVNGNRTTMDLAYCNIYTFPLSTDQQSQVMSYINTTYSEPHTYMDMVYTVTLSGNLIWLATPGNTSLQQPALTLSGGYIYYFNQGDASNLGETLYFSTTSNTYNGYYTTGVTSYTLQPVGMGSVNSYTTVSPTSAVTLYCNKTKTFEDITAGALFHYSCIDRNSINTVNGNVTLWRNQNTGINCVDVSFNTSYKYPSLTIYTTNDISMIQMGPSRIIMLSSEGGAYRVGQLCEQTLFYFGYTSAFPSSSSALISRTGAYIGSQSKLHFQYTGTRLELLNTGGGIDVSAGPIPGYVLCSYTAFSDAVSVNNTGGTYTFANIRKFPEQTYPNSTNSTKISTIGLNSETFNNFNIGCWDTDTLRTIQGAVGEVMYFNRVLTLPERQIIEGKIAWAYGLAPTLFNSTHPYYSAPPAPITTTVYTIKYSTLTKFAMTDSNASTVSQPFTVDSGTLYKFVLSDITNTGQTFRISRSSSSYTDISSSAVYTATIGIPGNSGAYATIMPTKTYRSAIYCYNG